MKFVFILTAAFLGTSAASMAPLTYESGGKCMQLTVKQQWEEAKKICKQEAEAGNRTAMYEYGYMFSTGSGVEKNKSTAKFWYEQAVKKESPYAMYNLATFYRDGIAGMRDTEQYVMLLKSAADLDFGKALAELSTLYHQGKVLKKNDKLAREYSRKAAMTGHAHSAFNYGQFLLQGIGGKTDANGFAWLMVALRLGYRTDFTEKDLLADFSEKEAEKKARFLKKIDEIVNQIKNNEKILWKKQI